MNDRNDFQSLSYACSYVPVEIIMAAGLLPRRMIPEPRPSGADAYMHPNTCYHIKSLLATGLAGDASPTKGIVIANSCDGMRRLYDLWSEYVKAVPAFFIDVPKKKDAASIEYFASELRRFAAKLETEFPGKKVTDEGVKEAISVCNNIRLLMEEVFRLQKDANSGVWGMSVFNLCMRDSNSAPEIFADRLREFISDPGEQKPAGDEQRIVLTGNIVHQPHLIALVEDAGGRVVVLDTCTGTRHYDTLTGENSPDPMAALAERYLLKASCPRMEGIDERVRRLKDLVTDSAADGVIYSTVKFCDMYLYEEPMIREECEKAGIPFLFLENDYEWAGLEQMRTRVEAFLSVTAGRRSN